MIRYSFLRVSNRERPRMIQKNSDSQNMSCRPHTSVLRFVPNLVAIAGFFGNTVHVRIFTGLDRNYLKYSLRIFEILLFMNAKVLFLVICLPSAIFYVTRHLVIYEVFALPLDNLDTHKKIKILIIIILRFL